MLHGSIQAEAEDRDRPGGPRMMESKCPVFGEVHIYPT